MRRMCDRIVHRGPDAYGSYVDARCALGHRRLSIIDLVTGDQPIFAQADAMAVLEQIEGALAYVDTLAPRPEVQRLRQVRARLEAAHNRLHQRLHALGVFHRHTPLHSHEAPHLH